MSVSLGGWLVSGEKLIYWSAGLLLLVIFFLLTLGIKEIDPKSPLMGQRLSVRTFFRALFDHDLWPVYSLAFGAAMLASGLGTAGQSSLHRPVELHKAGYGDQCRGGGRA